jgi:hypothetical protein
MIQGYARKFIPNISELQVPITSLYTIWTCDNYSKKDQILDSEDVFAFTKIATRRENKTFAQSSNPNFEETKFKTSFRA